MTKHTPLYDEHKKLNARFTEFFGWEMPVFYSSIIDEHTAVRTDVGMFDASHMGEIFITGEKASEFLDKVTPSTIKILKPGQCQYSQFLNENGGIIDDLLIYKLEKGFLLVVNASNTDKDLFWLQKNKIEGMSIENVSEKYALIAVQGPNSQKILQNLVKEDLAGIRYFNYIIPNFVEIESKEIILSRTGYTGEEGFEIFCDPESTPKIWERLLTLNVKPCGLGSRDTLRLEACLPLHGHEINDDINPIESGTKWIVDWNKDFIGKEALMKIKDKEKTKFLTGFVLDTGIPRQNFDIIVDGQPSGKVTSGTFSPTFKKGIGLGYVNKHLEIDKTIQVMVHNSPKNARIVKRPFYRRKKT